MKPSKRRCRWCRKLAAETELVRIGTTESTPGWCGGPRQGGRGVFMHAECVTACEEFEAASRERYQQELDEVRAELGRAVS